MLHRSLLLGKLQTETNTLKRPKIRLHEHLNVNSLRLPVSTYTGVAGDDTFSDDYWGIAQHTIVTRPELPGKGPTDALGIGGKPLNCGQAPGWRKPAA